MMEHTTTPIILAQGRLRHAGHLQTDPRESALALSWQLASTSLTVVFLHGDFHLDCPPLCRAYTTSSSGPRWRSAADLGLDLLCQRSMSL